MHKKMGDFSFKLIVGAIIFVVFASGIYYANDGFRQLDDEHLSLQETARVVEILSEDIQVVEGGFYRGEMRLLLEVETGMYTGAQTEVSYFLNQMTDRPLEIDDRMSIRISIVGGEVMSIHIQNPERREVVFSFLVLFLTVLGMLGGKRGLLAIASLVFTLTCVIFLLIPLMLRGYPVILTTFLILILVTIVSLTFLVGLSAKGISAMIGCLIGIMVTAILTHLSSRMAHISGFHMEEAGLILATTDFPVTQASGLLMSGVLIASLGAVMDTAVTIASTIHELRQNNPKMAAGKLFRSGMNVGRDTMGTMTCTLILAFAGTSLNMMILIYSGGTSLNQLINSDFMVIEIMRSIAGSLGIILTIPAVAFVSCVMD
ncbi:MAG: YibE/F family protein [Defluviitaleaceae bacterium]|nr:YibE/F family protein [Defluviitaleaceae bacterium]